MPQTPELAGRARPPRGRGRPPQGRGAHRDAVQGPARARRRACGCRRRRRRSCTDDAGDVSAWSGDARRRHRGRSARARASVLACGGFEWNPELVRTHIGYDVYPLSPRQQHRRRAEHGRRRSAPSWATSTSYWGTPVMFDSGDRARRRAGAAVRVGPRRAVVDRRQPHGQRFANEALPYNDFPKAFGVYDADAVEFPNAGPGFLVFDETVRRSQRHPVDACPTARPPTGWRAPTRSTELAVADRHRRRRARGDGRPLERARGRGRRSRLRPTQVRAHEPRGS